MMFGGMMFWVLAGVMAAVLVLALARPLLRNRGAAPAAADYDRAVYRDQLAELEQDVKRGLINAAEAEARSEEHTSELQSLMRISYAVFCLKQKKHEKHDKN